MAISPAVTRCAFALPPRTLQVLEADVKKEHNVTMGKEKGGKGKKEGERRKKWKWCHARPCLEYI